MLSGNQSVINLAPYWTRVASRGITAISHATTKAMNATGPTSNNEAMSRIIRVSSPKPSLVVKESSSQDQHRQETQAAGGTLDVHRSRN